MTLRRRILSLIALLLPLSLLAGGVLTYLYSVQLLKTEIAGAVDLGEATVREVLERLPAAADGPSQIARLVTSFDNDRDIRVIHVAPDGTVILASRMAPISNPPPGWLQRALVDRIDARNVPLPAGLEDLGAIRIEATPINEISEVWEEMTLQFVIMAGFFSLCLGLVSWTMGRALGPLENLSSAISQVAAGDFTAHVSESGPHELAAIYRQFNKMALRLKDAELQNRALNLQLSTVQEEERADIARDLHDEIGPFLFAVDVDAQTIPQYLDRGSPAEVTNRAASIRQSVAHMQTHLKSVLSRLRPAVLLDLGLAQAVDHLVKFWSKRHPNIEIETAIAQASFGNARDEVAFRVIQEAVNNAIRHAAPSHIVVAAEIDRAGRLAVSVSDDGRGMSHALAVGFGLSGMRERVASLGGTLDISAGPGDRGTQITAVLPAQRDKVEIEREADRRALTS